MTNLLEDNFNVKPLSGDSSRVLFLEHWDDFQKSGITLETAQKAGLYSVEVKELEGLIGWIPQQVKTAAFT
jgi:hypothetical protein